MPNRALRTVASASLSAALLALVPLPGSEPARVPLRDVELGVRVEVLDRADLRSLQDKLPSLSAVGQVPLVAGSASPQAMVRLGTLIEPNTLGRGSLGGDAGFGLVERIEVLRGPQGTLYGSGALAGTVRLVTRRPSSAGEELTVELESHCPAQTVGQGFEDVRRATCTAQLPAGGALLFNGFFDDATRAWTAGVPGLASSGPLGTFLASPAFQSGARDVYVVVSASGTAVGSPLNAVFCGLSPAELAAIDLGTPSVVVAPGEVLGAADLSGYFAARGTDGVLGTPSVVTADSVPCTLALGGEQRIDLRFTPRILETGAVALSFDSEANFPEASAGGQFDVTRRISSTALLQPGETLVLGGLVNERTIGANKVSFLGDLPLLGQLFRGDDNARADRALVIYVTPHIVDQDEEGRALSGAAPPTHALLAPEPEGYKIGGQASAVRQRLPSFDWLRTEIGGVIQKRPLASYDGDASGSELGVDVAKAIEWSLFGGRNPQVLIEARFIDVDTSVHDDVLGAGGFGLGIEDPNGSGFFITPGNGDVTNAQFDLDYRRYELALGISEGFDPCDDTALELATSLRYSSAKYEPSMTGVTNSGTLNIAREDDVDSWLLGPSLAGTLSRDFGGWKGYVGLDLTFGYGSADARTSVLVGNFPERARDVDDSQLVYELGARLGVRRERGDFSVGLEVGASYGNNFPVVEYQAFDPAELDFESEWSSQIGVGVWYRF